MFSKQQILDEIQRVAAVDGGAAPGKDRFARETGIRESDWSGRYWAKWSDAVVEAGLEPNQMQGRFEDDVIAVALIAEIRRIGRYPTVAEMRLRRRQDSTFPAYVVNGRRGGKSEIASLIANFCRQHPEDYEDVLAIVEPLVQQLGDDRIEGAATHVLGHVYLLKLGKHYKIGRSNAFGRRERELAIQMPERATTVHVINTDDPVGIEAYWHRRFAERRVRLDAEWFALTVDDVNAFKRRKFQ